MRPKAYRHIKRHDATVAAYSGALVGRVGVSDHRCYVEPSGRHMQVLGREYIWIDRFGDTGALFDNISQWGHTTLSNAAQTPYAEEVAEVFVHVFRGFVPHVAWYPYWAHTHERKPMSGVAELSPNAGEKSAVDV